MGLLSDTGASLLALAMATVLGAGPPVERTSVEDPPAEPTVVVIVSAASPTTSISRDHLAALYLGRASRFPDGRTAVPIDQGEGSPTRELFYREFLGRSAAQIKAHWSRIIFTGRGRPPRSLSSGGEVRRLIARDPSAIGYIDRALVDASVRVVEVG